VIFDRPKKYENPKFKEKEEQLRQTFTEQVKKEETRFRQWEAQVKEKQLRVGYDDSHYLYL
jgi:cell division control protein 12